MPAVPGPGSSVPSTPAPDDGRGHTKKTTLAFNKAGSGGPTTAKEIPTNICKLAALSRDAASSKAQKTSVAIAGANQKASSLSGACHVGGPASGSRAIETRHRFHCRRGALDCKPGCDAVCLCGQSVCHALAVRPRETAIADIAVVRARMGIVRPPAQQILALVGENASNLRLKQDAASRRAG